MGKYICHKDGVFFEWSTIVDAPVTYGMTEKEFREYYEIEYGRQGLKELDARLERAIKKGTSAFGDENLESLVCVNRAGPNETEITLDEIMQQLHVHQTTTGKDDDQR